MDADPFDSEPPDDEEDRPLLPHEREDVLAEIEELSQFRALLEPKGVRGIAVDCDDCGETHYLSWDLLVENLRHLLDDGRMRVHEPAFDPNPDDYVSWDYARGYADAVLDADPD
ncbi:MAG: hypothetical protein QOG53_1025 [Frankiales bacterium]|nr:hypothetical protein [Frankiales bacterium]